VRIRRWLNEKHKKMSRMWHAGRVQQTANKTNKQASALALVASLVGIFIHRRRMISVAPCESIGNASNANEQLTIKIIENDCQSGACVFVLAAPLDADNESACVRLGNSFLVDRSRVEFEPGKVAFRSTRALK
jgi:hypothetical protein